MNKESVNLILVVGILLVLSISFVSAGWFSDFFNDFFAKITGKVTEKNYTTLYYPNVTLAWGNPRVCSDATSITQFCMQKGYDGGEAGDSYSGGDCVRWDGSTWYGGPNSGVQDVLKHAKCYRNIEVDSGWTQWYDRDNPGGSGDWEDLTSLRSTYPGQICETPTQVECQTTNGIGYSQTGQNVTCSVNEGFYCINSNNLDSYCLDYRVRFYCGEIVRPEPCISCAAPPLGCNYVNGSCTSCGILVCEEDEGPLINITEPSLNISIYLTKEDFYVGEQITLK